MLEEVKHVLVVIAVLNVVQYCNGIPKRGNEPWSVILCKFADISFEPKSEQWFRQWFSDTNQPDSIERYFADISNGIYTINGSRIHGWLSLNYTLEEVRELANTDSKLQADPNERLFALYDKTKQLCIQTAKDAGEMLHEKKITIVNAEHSAVYGKKYGILVTPQLIFSSVVTHEMVHSFFIGHSYSDRNIKIFPHASTGEYDDVYDLMSTANAFMHPTPFGYSGPGLNGPHLDYLGWLPMHRVVYFGRDGKTIHRFRISSISTSHKATKGWLLVQIPYDRDDPGNVFTVEFRTKTHQDLGIRKSGIVIHKVIRVGPSYYSVVVTHAAGHFELTTGNEWVHPIGFDSLSNAQFIKIRVEHINDSLQYADVKVLSTFQPDACTANEVEVKLDNETNITDNHICVPKTASYNKNSLVNRQSQRQRFFKDRSTFGLNECVAGKTWRAIDAYDYVCVTPLRRSQVLRDSETNLLRKNESNCSEMFVRRSAFDGDDVCVTPKEHVQTMDDNSQNHLNLKHYSFFNGEDTVNDTNA